MHSFELDSRIRLALDYDLAVRLGEFIVSKGTEDKQIIALGYQLVNMEKEESASNNYRNYNYKQNIIRETGKILKNESYSENDYDYKERKTPIKLKK